MAAHYSIKYGISYNIGYNFFTRRYDTTLLGGEFANCDASGDTEDNAVRNLRTLVGMLRNIRKRKAIELEKFNKALTLN